MVRYKQFVGFRGFEPATHGIRDSTATHSPFFQSQRCTYSTCKSRESGERRNNGWTNRRGSQTRIFVRRGFERNGTQQHTSCRLSIHTIHVRGHAHKKHTRTHIQDTNIRYENVETEQKRPARVEMNENFYIFPLFLSPYSTEKSETLIFASWE